MNKVRIEPERGEAEVGDGAGPPGGPPGGPTAQGGAESAPEAYTICVRALSGESTTLEVDGADTIATVKKKFDAALLESGREPMKGLSLWHKNARLDEYRTLQSYGVGAGAVLQALATEHDVEVELREEREAEDRARAEAERSFGWKANYGCCVSKAEGERRRREAMEQAEQVEARRRAAAKAKAQRRAEIARDIAQLGPAQLKAKYDTSENREALWNAAEDGKTEDVRRYIDMGVDVDGDESWDNWTALHMAARRGHVAVVELLLAAGAQVDLKGSLSGCTPLCYAAYRGELDVVRLLLNGGADKTIADRHGRKPIDQVCSAGNKQHKDAIVALLRGEEDEPADEGRQGVRVTFVNAHHAPARVYRIHSDTGEIPVTEPIQAGESASVLSHPGHRFVAKHFETGERHSEFEISGESGQQFHIGANRVEIRQEEEFDAQPLATAVNGSDSSKAAELLAQWRFQDQEASRQGERVIRDGAAAVRPGERYFARFPRGPLGLSLSCVPAGVRVNGAFGAAKAEGVRARDMVMQIGGEDVVATPEALTELMGRKRKSAWREKRDFELTLLRAPPVDPEKAARHKKKMPKAPRRRSGRGSLRPPKPGPDGARPQSNGENDETTLMSRKEGYLLKCSSHSYRGFQKRYFVLEDGRLEYFQTEQEAGAQRGRGERKHVMALEPRTTTTVEGPTSAQSGAANDRTAAPRADEDQKATPGDAPATRP